MPGQACGINRATTLGEKLWKKPWVTSSSTQWQLHYQHALDHDKGTQHHWPGSCLPKNSTMAKCRNTDTTWKWPSVGGIQLTKKQLRSKTSSHIIPSCMKGQVQTLRQNCASRNQHKAQKVHRKARSSCHGRTVRSRKLGQKNMPETGRMEELDQTQTQTQSCNGYQNWAVQADSLLQKKWNGKTENSVLKQHWHSSGNSTNK